MPRRPRIAIAGYPMHVVLRGVDRCAIFFCDGDCRDFLGKLAERAKAESVDVHAYVLMTNHLLCEASHNRCNVKSPIM